MRLDCLTSALFPSELASRDVGTLLDCGWSFESDSSRGEDTGPLGDPCIGATIGRGASSAENCAHALFVQDSRASAIAAQALRAKQKRWRRDRAPLARFKETVRGNASESISV